MFSYAGSKSKLIEYYPLPQYDLIIEPFAGSARYALRYFYNDVILVDKYPAVVKVWHYLQLSSKQDILKLPKLTAGLDLRTLGLSDEELLFLGFMCGIGRGRPAFTVSPFAAVHFSELGRRNRYEKIAEQLYKIRHWRIVLGDYACLNNAPATYFIDPPYMTAGKAYHHNNAGFDYCALAAWVQTRRGQVIVCENVGASWLPFVPLARLHGATKMSHEAVYTAAP